MKAFKWWDEEPLPQGLQWLGLEHNGIFFPPDYESHGVKMLYDGQEVDLPAELEEVGTHTWHMKIQWRHGAWAEIN
jgi:DNA topoisomerase-1